MGRASDGILGRLSQILRSPAVIEPPLEMHGQLGCGLSRSVSVRSLFMFTNTLVQPQASLRANAFIQHILIQSMRKFIVPGCCPIGPLAESEWSEELPVPCQHFTPGLDLGY